MSFKYFDIHSHLNLSPLKEKRDELAVQLKEREMGTITVGVDLETSRESIEIAEKYEHIFACVGQHPTDSEQSFDEEAFLELAKHPRVVSIGECGLDYFRKKTPEIVSYQKEVFRKQIDIAIKLGKPLMIHARPSKGTMDAYEDVITMLASSGEKLAANFHFFVGDINIAKQIVENGWTVSFDGPITFARDYDEVIKFLPLENIMAETDAPFACPEPYRSGGVGAAPASYRGKGCEPWMVEEVYKKIAEIKDIPVETVQKVLAENIKRVFDIG